MLKLTKYALTDQVRRILFLFISWKIFLFLVLILAILFMPLRSHNFLGGGLQNYLNNPILFAWANFDGEHYLSIAEVGYSQFNHSFFPLYPFVISLFGLLNDSMSIVIFGVLVSNLLFLISLFVLSKLVMIDYSKKIALLTILSLLSFPTSFYFGALYTESLFLFLVLTSFYFGRKGNFLLAGIFGALSSATRITGVFLFPSLLIEAWSKKSLKILLPIFLVPLGLLGYMYYLYQQTGDPLIFYKELSVYGEQRAGDFILLPQVFFRYFKILSSVNIDQSIYLTALVEVTSALLAITLLILAYLKKVRLSYVLFGALSFLLPTLTGSFSSLPRYLLTIFPLFIVLGIFFSKLSTIPKVAIYLLMLILLSIETALFIRGYWVA